jgi:hypothetical protein
MNYKKYGIYRMEHYQNEIIELKRQWWCHTLLFGIADLISSSLLLRFDACPPSFSGGKIWGGSLESD